MDILSQAEIDNLLAALNKEDFNSERYAEIRKAAELFREWLEENYKAPEPQDGWISAEEAAKILKTSAYQIKAAMRHHELNIGLYIPYPNKKGGQYKVSKKRALEQAREWGLK